MRTAAGSRLPLTVVLLPAGGHSYGVWSVETPPALDWLSTYLPAPATPPLAIPGATVVATSPTPGS